LTNSDRAAVGVNAAVSGSIFGKGIYTANNPYAFSRFGPIGIFVARLKGTCVKWDDLGGNEALVSAGMHTVLGNKQKGVPDTDEVVLRNSSQCLPLLCYNSIPLGDKDVKSVLRKITVSLQKLADQCLSCNLPLYNESPSHLATPCNCKSNALAEEKSTLIRGPGKLSSESIPSTRAESRGKHDHSSQGGRFPTALPSTVSGVRRHLPDTRIGTSFDAHAGPANVSLSLSLTETLTYYAPKSLFHDKDDCYHVCPVSYGECAVCLETFSFTERPVALLICSHEFHANCMQAVLQRSNQCPKCRRQVRELQGISPSGTMTVTWSSAPC